MVEPKDVIASFKKTAQELLFNEAVDLSGQQIEASVFSDGKVEFLSTNSGEKLTLKDLSKSDIGHLSWLLEEIAKRLEK